ncbi:hypothetical protein niasHT_013812 [Heterodera trifolii]|uniref:Uncharacterized protein n=1 Tax=Heterodera trifolii TaxID=157864 RepID=A0ABD2KVE6_9BILA
MQHIDSDDAKIQSKQNHNNDKIKKAHASIGNRDANRFDNHHDQSNHQTVADQMDQQHVNANDDGNQPKHHHNNASSSHCDACNHDGQRDRNGVGGNSADGNQSSQHRNNNGNNDGPDDNDAANDQLVQLHANRNGDGCDQPENDNVDGPQPEIHNANDNLGDNDEELTKIGTVCLRSLMYQN